VSDSSRSPIAEIYDALRACNASWSVDIGRPSGPGWIAGADLRDALAGPFNELLLRIGSRQGSGRCCAQRVPHRAQSAAICRPQPELHQQHEGEAAHQLASQRGKECLFDREQKSAHSHFRFGMKQSAGVLAQPSVWLTRGSLGGAVTHQRDSWSALTATTAFDLSFTPARVD